LLLLPLLAAALVALLKASAEAQRARAARGGPRNVVVSCLVVALLAFESFFRFCVCPPGSWLARLLLLAAAAWPVDVCNACARAAAIGAAVAVELRAAGPFAMVPHLARISPNNASPCEAKASSCR